MNSFLYFFINFKGLYRWLFLLETHLYYIAYCVCVIEIDRNRIKDDGELRRRFKIKHTRLRREKKED